MPNKSLQGAQKEASERPAEDVESQGDRQVALKKQLSEAETRALREGLTKGSISQDQIDKAVGEKIG